MFLPEMLLWLSENGWLMLLHLSARASFPKPLDKDEEAALIERMFAGDSQAAAGLIEHNLRLVAHIAKKYAQAGVDQDDLISIGSLGLIKAVQTFRPEAGRLPQNACCDAIHLPGAGMTPCPKRPALSLGGTKILERD